MQSRNGERRSHRRRLEGLFESLLESGRVAVQLLEALNEVLRVLSHRSVDPSTPKKKQRISNKKKSNAGKILKEKGMRAFLHTRIMFLSWSASISLAHSRSLRRSVMPSMFACWYSKNCCGAHERKKKTYTQNARACNSSSASPSSINVP